jgi:ribosomal protein S18 acetylase RimI-like enzyme
VDRIRPAVEADAAELARLAERTFRETFAEGNDPVAMDAHCGRAFGESIQAAEIRDPGRVTLVCEEAARLTGFGQLRWSSAPACVVASRPAEIQRLYVDAPWHGRGVAQRLMQALLDAAARGNADVAWLGVWVHNPRAMRFYEKCGFAAVGDHVFVLGSEPQRDLVFAKSLPGHRA